jgi:hypothetical protein
MTRKIIASLFFALFAALGVAAGQQSCDAVTASGRDANSYNASAYNTWRAQVYSAPSTTGSGTLVIRQNGVTICGNYRFQPFSVTAPISVGVGAAAETVTPTAVSGCVLNGPTNSCAVTATFANVHGPGEIITSGSLGVQEAVNDAFAAGGGLVTVGPSFTSVGGTDAILNAVVPYPNVSIQDNRKGAVQNWNSLPSTTSLLAAGTTLTPQAACDATHQFCSDPTVVGSASWATAVYGCYTLVDINGNESPCSSTQNFVPVASKAIDMGVSLTARTDNVVGWKPYLSVANGSYALAYSVPLLTQPTTLLAVPVSTGVCTLTTLETTTPACAIANSVYGQAGSTVGVSALFKGGMQFTGYPVVTSTLAPEIGSVSATAYNPNEEAHATYAYVPGNRIGIPNVQAQHIVFPITAAAQTAVGEVAGSFPLPANFMNYVGRTIEVCGLFVKTSTTADTLTKFQLWWDAEGSNVTAGTPVQLTNMQSTYATALAAAANFQFCQQITTTVASTSATGGSITPGQGWLTVDQVAAGVNPSAGSTNLVAAVGSLNLALPAHLTLVVNHATGTDGAGATLIGASLRVVN